MSLPTGTVTFLLSDIEASTHLWEADRAAMAAAVARHYEILDKAIAAAGGARPVEQGEGDSVVGAFTRATDALNAAVATQLAFAAEEWPGTVDLSVRIALHTGEANLRDGGNYFGPAIIRCARLRALAHGGQILCSRATADVLWDALPNEVVLRDLGTHLLKDLSRPEHVFGVGHPALRSDFPALRSAAAPSNLPVELTSFVGREVELAELVSLAGTNRLVSLTGSGGVGKTRLASRAAAALSDAHPDGAWWVDLAPLADPDLVVQSVLTVLGVGDVAGRLPLERLIAHLTPRRLLLVLDNCEHLVEACAHLLDALLRSCPELRALATSREALGVADEVVWRVPSMGRDAIALFGERARKVRPNFVADDTAVAEICARLDGIPLAIELAAARARALTAHQILAELEDRFRLLTGRTRGALARQQTLEASVVWSHDLLTDAERTLFRRLSVFAGGFTLDAAESVAPAAGPGVERGEVLDLLDTLLAKSMLVVVDAVDGAVARYRLLETMRAFGGRELSRAGETAAARDGHLSHYLGVLRVAYEDLVRVSPAVLARYIVDADNFRTALEWALSGDPDVAVETTLPWAAMCLFRSRYSEGRHWASRAAELSGTSVAGKVDALWCLGAAQVCLADLAGVRASADEARRLAEHDDRPRVLSRMYHLQSLAAMFVDPEATLAAVDAATPQAEAAADLLVLLDLELNRFFALMRADDLPGADRAFEGSQSVATRLGNEFIGSWNHGYEAVLALRAGRLDRARVAAGTGLRLARGLGEMGAAALSNAALAELELLSGSLGQALGLAELALAECEEAGGSQMKNYLLTTRGRVLAELGRHDEADPALRRALDEATAVQDPWQQAQAALALARELARFGDAREVDGLLEIARVCAGRLRSPWVPAVADHLAGLAAADPAAAEDLQHAALAVHVAQGYALDVVDVLEALADLAGRQGSGAEAARLLGATAARRAELGYRLGAPDVAAVREEFAEEFAEGEALSIEAAVAYATRARGERGRPSFGWASLTPTELEVARLAAQGGTNAEIGAALFVSLNTVKAHLSHVYAKLGLANRAELAVEVTRRQI
ncbi:MAG: helix-turn-helix transcriptional regulator [Sporichthyaceae bacterium]